MPEELTLNEIMETVGHDWLDRQVLSNMLKAFGIEPSGKRINPKGGRPASLYPATKSLDAVRIVASFRENDK